jgi:hypothetical protein
MVRCWKIELLDTKLFALFHWPLIFFTEVDHTTQPALVFGSSACITRKLEQLDIMSLHHIHCTISLESGGTQKARLPSQQSHQWV